MGKPIATKNAAYRCFAFPDVCFTPPVTPGSPSGIPIPYPNIGQLSQATKVSGDQGTKPVRIGGDPIVIKTSEIPTSSGDEAGTLGGVTSGQPNMGKVTFTAASATVKVNGEGVVRFGDTTQQNNANISGLVLGGVSTVRAGG